MRYSQGGIDLRLFFHYCSDMPLTSIAAHYDGKQVLFDEEVDLRPHTRLLVTILKDQDSDRQEFLSLAATALADSYGEDEVEYSEADLKS